MIQKKIAIRCSGGEDYDRNKNYINIDTDRLLLIDKNPEKGINPDDVKDTDYSFITIASSKNRAEILEEFKLRKVPSWKVVPWTFFEMQRAHFHTYSYLNEWGKMLSEYTDVVENWYEDGIGMSALIRIANKIGYRIRIHFLNLTKNSERLFIKVTDEKSGRLIKEYQGIDCIGDIDILCKSSDLLLKISTNIKKFIHISLEFEKTEVVNALDEVLSLYDKQLREIFYSNVKKLTSQFPYHEEDYLFFRNFKDISDSYMVDGGVNYGQSTYSFLHAMPNMKVIGFEANPLLAHVMSTVSRYMNNFKLFDKGLAAQSGEMKFYVVKNIGISGSFIREDLEKRAKQWNSVSDIQEQIVATCSLDDTLKDKNVAFIKLDIEGYEYEALLGAGKVLEECRPILLVENNRASAEAIAKLLEGKYRKFYYNYITNCLVNTNECNSINYFLIPINGTANEYVNGVLKRIIK